MDAATLVYDIDSSRARTAVTDLNKLTNESVKLARAFGQSGQALRQANGRFSSSADVARRYGAEIQNLADKYNPALSAAMRFQRAEVEVNRALALGVINKKQAADQIARLGREMQTTSRAGTVAAASMRRLGIQLAAIAAASFGARALKSAVDGWSDLQSVVGAAINDMEGAPVVMREILRLANETYSPLDQTARGFARNVQSLKDLGYNTDAAMKYTAALNNALVITATRGERAASVQNALSRAMATGRLQADGLETVLSNAGRVSQALADELGVTVSGLRKLASEGKITGDVIARALTGRITELTEEAAEMPATIEDGFLRIGNSLTGAIGAFDKAAGASGALAGGLDVVAESLGRLAAADFTKVIDGMKTAALGFGAVVVGLGATQIPVVVGATRVWITTNGVLTSTLWASTAALSAKSAAMTRLASATRMAGGPVGILVGGMAALAVHLYTTRGRVSDLSDEFMAMQGRVNDTATALAIYREQQNLTTATQAFAAVKNDLEAVRQTLTAAAETAATLQTRLDLAERVGGATDAMREQAAQALADLQSVSDRNQILTAQYSWLSDMVEVYTSNLSEARTQTEGLTDAQTESLASANEMLRNSARRVEILRLENAYGKDIAAVQVMQYRNERDLFAAKVATLDVADDIKQALMDTWEEEKRLTGETAEWDRAMNVLKGTAADVLQAMRDIDAAEPGATWLDTAIGKAQTLADVLWDGLGALGREGGRTPVSGTRPPRRPFELGVPDPPKPGRGGGGGGGGGGKSEADTLREEMQRRWEVLNEAFQAEFSLAIAAYTKDQETLKWALDTKLITQEQYNQQLAMMRVQAFGTEFEQHQLQYQMDQDALQMALDSKIISYEEYYRRLKELQFANLMSDVNRTDMAQDLSNTAQYFGMLNTLTGNGYDGLLRLQQTFAAASALISAYQGAVGAMADTGGPFWVRLAAYGKVLAAGLGAVAAIKGGGRGGGAGGAGTAPTQAAQQEPQRTVLVNLQGDEFLVGLAEDVLEQIYEQSKDGRVIVSRI